jgi:NitT/TauT family transport system ATP-binding protein
MSPDPLFSARHLMIPPAHIELRSITHAYKTDTGLLPVLDNLQIEMAKGSFTAVVGPSGCGKSTLTRLIAGLMKPDEGQVWLGGQLVTSPRPTVGMAFQNPVLLEWRSILQNVILPLEIVAPRMPRKDKEERARSLLSLVGLEGFEDKRPSELSGGMRQRASLCRAIVHRPEVLILDEPFGALDAFTREDLWQTMHDLRAEEPFTCVLITHDLRESVFLADEVVVLSGRPATTQFILDVDIPGKRTIEDLYTPKAIEMLATLRHQIQVAQGRAAQTPDVTAPNASAKSAASGMSR